MIFNKNLKIDLGTSGQVLLNIVSDASITSMAIANGKMIPLIILDTTKNPEIEQAILLHSDIMSFGHVSTIWGSSSNYKCIILKFEFTDPVQMQFIIPFDTIKQSGLIDLIINSQLVYIQAGKPGDRLSNTMNAERILIEVPSNQFEEEWKKIFIKVMTKHFKNQGLSKKKAKKAVDDLYNEWGKIRNLRVKKS